MRKANTIVLTLLILILFVGNAFAEKQVVLTFLGDCTIGGEDRLVNKDFSFAKVAEREGYTYFFAKVEPLIAQDDLTIANFEGVLKNDKFGNDNKRYCFRGLPAYAAILKLGSVEAVNLANNHSGDYDIHGYRATWDALLAGGVQPFSTTQPYLVDCKGVKVAVVGIYAAGFYAKRKIMRDAIQNVRDLGADTVVCMIHAGQEYDGEHGKTQSLIAHLLIDAGADVVIGTHPHVLQGLEVYQQRNILYSIGNFVFGGNATVRSAETVLARVTLTFGDDNTYLGQQLRLYPANMSGEAEANNYQPVLVQGEQADAVYALIDRDSEGQPEPTLQTDSYREYGYLNAQVSVVEP